MNKKIVIHIAKIGQKLSTAIHRQFTSNLNRMWKKIKGCPQGVKTPLFFCFFYINVLRWWVQFLDDDIKIAFKVFVCFKHFSNFIMTVYNSSMVTVTHNFSDILERIKKDKKLMGALDSEIYSDYNSKALTAGFYAAMQMGLLVYCFGDFFNLSVRMGALVIVVVAMLFSEIRRLLLYNPYKDGK